jgi:hypothetical protein
MKDLHLVSVEALVSILTIFTCMQTSNAAFLYFRCVVFLSKEKLKTKASHKMFSEIGTHGYNGLIDLMQIV